MERNVEIGLLFSIYRNMLTDRQAESIDLYYNEDLSLSEISEHMGITRQGVRDNIKRAESTLFDVEKRLGLAKRFLNIKEDWSSGNKGIKNIFIVFKVVSYYESSEYLSFWRTLYYLLRSLLFCCLKHG